MDGSGGFAITPDEVKDIAVRQLPPIAEAFADSVHPAQDMELPSGAKVMTSGDLQDQYNAAVNALADRRASFAKALDTAAKTLEAIAEAHKGNEKTIAGE